MTHFWASLSYWIAGSLALLTFLDWVLTDRQKKWITDRTIALFIWLDDQRELRYLRLLGKFRWQFIVIILYAVVALAAGSFVAFGIYSGLFQEVAANDPDIPPHLEYYLLSAYIGSFIGALFMVRVVLGPVLNWITRTEGSWAYIGRSTFAFLAIVAAVFLVSGVDFLFMAQSSSGVQNRDGKEIFRELVSKQPFISNVYNAILATIVISIFVSWLLVVVPVILVLILIVLFRVLQFATARIAESPKGPILGLIAVLTAIGALLQLFQHQ
jgi:hypothetical protein